MSEEINSNTLKVAMMQIKRNKSRLTANISALITNFEKENHVKVSDIVFDSETGNVFVQVEIR